MDETRISRLIELLNQVADVGGSREQTKMLPNREVINATPAGMANYVIVEDEGGYYIPAVKVPGVSYTNGDLVNLLKIKGTEAIAFQQGSGSGSSGIAIHDHSDDTEGGPDLHAIEELEFDDAAALTIDAAGAITRTQVYHEVDTFGGAASDNLDTINGGVEGDLLIIKAANGARTVVVRHNQDNIWLSGETNISLDDADDHLMLVYDGTYWCDVGWSAGGGWKFDTDDLLVVGADGDYATVAAAIAAAAAGDTIWLDIGTWTCDAQTLPDGVNIIGLDKDACILRTTTQFTTLTAGNGSYIANLTIENEYAVALGTVTALSVGVGDTVECFNCKFYANNTDGAAAGANAVNNSGTVSLRQCEANGTGAAGTRLGLSNYSTAYIYGGKYTGDTYGVRNQAGGDHSYFREPAYVASMLNSNTTGTGISGGVVFPDGLITDITQNTSGGAVAAGAVGYLDENGEFKTTATAYSNVAWCVAMCGAANSANVYITRQGSPITVTLNGNCSAGDYLYTSTTAGQAQPQSYVRPEVFAVALTANAAGAGGTCSARLLCGRMTYTLTSTNDVFDINGASDSDWQSTQNGAPAGAVITYNTPLTAGAEDTIVPAAATQLGKLVLHNTTRGEEAFISSVNIVANTITVTDAADVAAWVNGNGLEVRSQTNTDTLAAGIYFFDVEITSAEVPALATMLGFNWFYRDTGAANESCVLHPYETGVGSKRFTITGQVANIFFRGYGFASLNQRRFTIAWTASGVGTGRPILKLHEVTVAIP